MSHGYTEAQKAKSLILIRIAINWHWADILYALFYLKLIVSQGVCNIIPILNNHEDIESQKYWITFQVHPACKKDLKTILGCVLTLQSCPALWNPMDCSPRGSSIHRILQAKILEWVAMPSFRGSYWPRDWTCVSCVSCTASELFSHWAIREVLWSF